MAAITHFSELDLTKEYSFSDYLQWQFSERVELLKGFIKQMSPAPSRKHQTVSFNLTLLIGSLFKNKTCRVFAAPFDVRLPIASAKKTPLWCNLIRVSFATRVNWTITAATARPI
jgi:hypothetical protein